MAPRPKPMTLTQKILFHHAVGLRRPWVESGETVRLRVDWAIASELASRFPCESTAPFGRPVVPDV